MTQIHPTAVIADCAKIGANVRIGAYAVIGEQVEIGDDSIIDPHAVIASHVKMGRQNRVHSHAVIGGLPQDLSFDPTLISWVEIGDNNSFREGSTVSRASFEHRSTQIGSHCYLMNNAHVAHDCIVGDHNIFATSATLGGHVTVGDRVFFGGGSMVHQFTRIGSFAMIAGVLGVRKDVIPYALVGGSPVRHYRLNVVGLRRAGVTGQRYRELADAWRCLRENRPLDGIAETPETLYLKSWLQGESKRGIYGFISATGEA